MTTFDEVTVHDTTVEPVIVDEVKVDDLTVEPSTLLSVNVLSEVTEFVHVDLVTVLPFPGQSPPYDPEVSGDELKRNVTINASNSYLLQIKLLVVT